MSDWLHIAKQELVSTNQKPRSEWRRSAPPLALWFYVLSKTFFAIALCSNQNQENSKSVALQRF
ncbi:MAG: hypothetical protein DCE90_08385 [Pseudanabaena sp.]|nr:MAG: hypothetical protein DCE90_08385 [Pseudanabaena sp.]